MNRRDLVKVLKDAGFRVMPPEEARKFHRVLGGGRFSLPRDNLPPITTHRRTRPKKARVRRAIVPDQLALL